VVLTSQVFVSHTSDVAQSPGGRSFVQAVLDAVSRAGMVAVDMRYFAARDGKPAEFCRQRVRQCEIYVAVIGFRYGSMVPGEAVSYTELEFDEASSAGLPRLVFLLDDTAGLPPGLADVDRGAVEGFRQRLRDAGLVVRGFTSDASLELEVFHALTDVTGSARSAVPGSAPSALEVRYSLPADTAAFTGRDDELGRITVAVTDAAGAGGVVAIHAIGGMPGVGKTALAVHAAHRLRSGFPDRQLFINLHGHTPGHDPMLPEAALAELLAAVGLDPRHLPADLAGRAGLWRDKMAGQRALLVLDNAAGSAQVAPLLPGGAGCLVLVTSRRHLGDLPGAVVPVLVDALSPDHAGKMFMRLAPRAAAQPAAVAELVRLAGYLPLAISLLARVYARHPSWTLADLTAETQESLLTLAAENDSVAAAFEVSYGYLDPARRQFFRRLGLHPGTTTDAYSAAALADVPLDEADGLLEGLHGEGLLTEPGYRRYGMHDLIRRYAHNLAATDPAADREKALERLLEYYQHTAGIAEALLARQSRTRHAAAAPTAPPPAVPGLPDGTRALAWARAERANLLACIDHVKRGGQHARVVALTAAIATLLRQDGPWADAITRHSTAIQAARLLDDRLGHANALNDLAAVRYLTGDFLGAADVLQEALGIYRDLGDRQGQANALNDLGGVRQTGDYRGAEEALGEALRIYRDLGDRQGQANALNYIGVVQGMTGHFPFAAETLEEALGIYRGLGDRMGQAKALNDLAAVRQLTGDFLGAADVLEEALEICRDLGYRLGRANALHRLGGVRWRTGDPRDAADVLEEALGIYRDLGDRVGQANALCGLGAARRVAGDYRSAADALEEALSIYRDIGNRGGEAETLNEIGTLHRVCGDWGKAEVHHRQALDLARQIDGSWDEAQALAGLGRCALAIGRIADTRAGLRQALEIFQEMGAAEAAEVAAELDALAETEPDD
jgi:tetratricopeptide (TPR) repeat protein